MMQRSMGTLALAVVFGLVSTGFLAASEETGADSIHAFTGVTVIPMDTDAAIPDQTVLVRDGRIVAIGPSDLVTPPAGAVIIEGAGRFLIPGLADMHVHTWGEKEFPLYLANGVTTVRNMWGSPRHVLWRRQAEAGEILAPTVYSTSTLLDGDPPIWQGSQVVTTVDQANQIVAAQKAAGFRDLKVYNRLTPEVYDALVDAARRTGMRIVGHVPDAIGLHGALDAGQASIEHLTGYMLAVQEEGSPAASAKGFSKYTVAANHIDRSKIPEVAAATRAAGTWNCVTLVVMDRFGATPDEREEMLRAPEMRYVAPAMKETWDPKNDFRLKQMKPEDFEGLRRGRSIRRDITRALHDAGARILLGTDTPNPLVIPGFSIHVELENLVESGLSPYAALRAGTADAAEFLDAAGEFGTVRVGARADLILLEANPLEDVAHVKRRVGVMVRGRWLPEADLQRRLEDVAKSYEPKKDPFEGLEPLAREGAREHEATYEMRMGDAPIGYERIAVERLASGERVYLAQSILTAYSSTETVTRILAGDGAAGASVTVVLRMSGTTSRIECTRAGDSLAVTGTWGGKGVDRRVPVAPDQLLSPSSLAATLLLAHRVGGLAVGEETDVPEKTIAAFPGLGFHDQSSRVKREADPEPGSRAYSMESETQTGPVRGRLVVDSSGIPTRLRLEQSFGAIEFLRLRE